MGYDKVTYRQLFIVGVFLIFPVSFVVSVYTMSNYSDTNDILSLFLTGIYALVYVILLHLVLKMAVRNEDNGKRISGKKGRKTVIGLIYVVRYGIRWIFLLYLFVSCCKRLMLPDTGKGWIVGILLLAICYMAGKGLAGYVGFAEASVAGLLLCLVLFVICGFENAKIARLAGYLTVGKETSICGTISEAMAKGYFLLIGLCMLEFVMMLYLKIKKRSRGMLVMTVSVPFVSGLIGSCFVIALLGDSFEANGGKSILNVVGAMMFPGRAYARLAVLSCYGIVLCGILLMAIHALYICRFLQEIKADLRAVPAEKQQTPSVRLRLAVCIWIFVGYLFADKLFESYEAGRLIMYYMAAVDLPLSVLVPAFACRKRTQPRKLSRMAAEILAAFMLICLLGGCMDKSMEEVDYLRVVLIRRADDGYEFELVADSLEGAESANDSREESVTVYADSLKQACARYDASHDRSLDLSHVEYIVVDQMDVVDALYPELSEQFVTNYVEVICTDVSSLWDASEHVRASIKAHYQGTCLAAYVPE